MQQNVTKDGGEKDKSKKDDQQIPLQTDISSSLPSITPPLLITIQSLVSCHCNNKKWELPSLVRLLCTMEVEADFRLIWKSKSHVASQSWPQFLICLLRGAANVSHAYHETLGWVCLTEIVLTRLTFHCWYLSASTGKFSKQMVPMEGFWRILN